MVLPLASSRTMPPTGTAPHVGLRIEHVLHSAGRAVGAVGEDQLAALPREALERLAARSVGDLDGRDRTSPHQLGVDARVGTDGAGAAITVASTAVSM